MTGIHKRHWPGDKGRPALALHCMMGSAGYWGPISRRLDGRVDLTGFDMPSHGRSGSWVAGSEGPDFHTAVTRIAASFIDRPLDLIGHSLGATVALRIAVAAPEAIRSLTLIEPVLFAAASDAEQEHRDRVISGFLAEGRIEDAARAFIDVWGAQAFDDLPLPARRMMAEQIPLVAEADDTLTNDRANILRDGGLEAIDAPVLIIAGQQSPKVIHGIADALAERLADVGRATVPGAGHMLPLTHPDETAGLIAVSLDRA
ncbi:alpha/beta fold hydrolase [Paracoccus benzoatiresistens]|uniref:Alpha/beta fold hydrolase n=1 Tax=Paracoccus benzoatiresistens TaxID=2997341 RepID=A0ABT4J3Y3_9RHOB|nr:alpha/beta fold hydrolase [Paracoccus sp. EF6]MCZ0961802.1 alpha/beta fold hydrolase [Paracoccus sp. EF6]